jgi:hypothetical protein
VPLLRYVGSSCAGQQQQQQHCSWCASYQLLCLTQRITQQLQDSFLLRNWPSPPTQQPCVELVCLLYRGSSCKKQQAFNATYPVNTNWPHHKTCLSCCHMSDVQRIQLCKDEGFKGPAIAPENTNYPHHVTELILHPAACLCACCAEDSALQGQRLQGHRPR